MLNHKGEVAECTGDNIFVVRKGELHTPPIDAGILEGITRDAVIELARAAGIAVFERSMDRHDIYTADECFLTGTAAEVIPVVECDGRAIGTGKPGPITNDLRRAVPHAGPRGAIGRPHDVIEIRKILAPTDFSPHAENAVRYACGLAERLGAELHLLHVLSEIVPTGPDPLLTPVLPPEYYRESEVQSREALAKLIEPSWGNAAGRRDRGPLGEPGRGDRRLRARRRRST